MPGIIEKNFFVSQVVLLVTVQVNIVVLVIFFASVSVLLLLGYYNGLVMTVCQPFRAKKTEL